MSAERQKTAKTGTRSSFWEHPGIDYDGFVLLRSVLFWASGCHLRRDRSESVSKT